MAETTPIRGYRTLSQDELNEINRLKAAEHDSLEALNEAFERLGIDSLDMRWLAIARSHLEQGWMAACRAIARPESLDPAWMQLPLAGRKPPRAAPAEASVTVSEELHRLADEKQNGGPRR